MRIDGGINPGYGYAMEDDEQELTYKDPVWWFGLIITTMIIAAIIIFISDIIHSTPDDSWKPNPLNYNWSFAKRPCTL